MCLCSMVSWLSYTVFPSIFNLMCTRVEISLSSYFALVVFGDALAAYICKWHLENMSGSWILYGA